MNARQMLVERDLAKGLIRVCQSCPCGCRRAAIVYGSDDGGKSMRIVNATCAACGSPVVIVEREVVA